MSTFDFNSKEFKNFRILGILQKCVYIISKYLRESCVKLLLLIVQNRLKFYLYIPVVPIKFLNKKISKTESNKLIDRKILKYLKQISTYNLKTEKVTHN